MAVVPFLAMTAAEFCGSSFLPAKVGWMACHFSPYSVGLSNLPRNLPEGSLLIVNDITPIHGHDPEIIVDQLRNCVDNLRCSGVLLDLQRADSEETMFMAKEIVDTLPCAVAVSEIYAGGLSCPVFLPHLPHHIPLVDWIKPWQGREIWLEVALDAEEITLTKNDTSIHSLPCSLPEDGHPEEILHCHYQLRLQEDSATFTLWRTRDDIASLLEEAESLNIHTAVGLWQEFQ